ncbi:MAG TPA: RIO1 family regulatory kinase/ATPase [Thermoplasmata archaeon]|jgi:RIO kinase 1|nr:RIO1 family regulatory kinase/ATPase [Thermoplasmata archaeon]
MPNDGYLDKSVHWKVRTGQIAFAEPTHEEVADAILDAGLATEVGQRLGSGKEADVYLARDGPRLVAVKVYRQYRTAHRGGGSIKLESMGQRAVREFELLTYAYQGGAKVPKPGERVENMFTMQYLGTAEAAAPMLQKAALDDPEPFLRATLDGIEGLAEAGIVHSDLSPFNILVHDGAPWFIDLAAGVRVDRLGWPPWQRLSEAMESLRHGLASLERHFRRYELEFDAAAITARVRTQIDRFGVMTPP